MNLKLVITSDMVCAWCFIGVKRLQDALIENPEIHLTIHWRPFELNPDMPKSGMDRIEYFNQKFDPSKRAAVEDRARQAAIESGLDIDWQRIRRMPNTRDAHVLMTLAAQTGHANQLHDALTQAHFVNGQDIGDRSVLKVIAENTGMVLGDIDNALTRPEVVDWVSEQESASIQEGIAGVPSFCFPSFQPIHGAVDKATWVAAFRSLIKQADK
jgi:predicted DsbA family dithiol-disulfide isomerase